MNILELSAKLVQKGIPTDTYCLSGGLPNERLCIAKGEYWEVYYSERGLKTQLHIFETEDAACGYIYDELVKESKK